MYHIEHIQTWENSYSFLNNFERVSTPIWSRDERRIALSAVYVVRGGIAQLEGDFCDLHVQHPLEPNPQTVVFA